MQDQQGRLKMVTYFTQVCSSFLSKMKAKMSKAGLDQIHRQFGLESVQFLQALPMYASKHDFLGKLQQKQCVVLKSAAGSGTRSTCHQVLPLLMSHLQLYSHCICILKT